MRIGVAALVATVAVGGSAALAETPTVAQTLRLTSKDAATRWISLAPHDRARSTIPTRPHVKVLVTGDSMVWGIFEGLDSLLERRGVTVVGDPHPGSGVSKPLLDWAAHARRSVRTVRPDATVVFLGSADDEYPLKTSSGATVRYPAPAWIAEYARRVRGMMATYRRGGEGRVYWVLLPAHRDPGPEGVFRAVNTAVRLAARRFPAGVTVVDEIADVLAPADRFHARIRYHGRRLTVRRDDGYHLASDGRLIAARILFAAMRRDGLVRDRR